MPELLKPCIICINRKMSLSYYPSMAAHTYPVYSAPTSSEDTASSRSSSPSFDAEDLIAALQNPELLDDDALYLAAANAQAATKEWQDEYLALDAEVHRKAPNGRPRANPRKLQVASVYEAKHDKDTWRAAHPDRPFRSESPPNLPKTRGRGRGRQTTSKHTTNTPKILKAAPGKVTKPAARNTSRLASSNTIAEPLVAKARIRNDLKIDMNVPDPTETLGKRAHKQRFHFDEKKPAAVNKRKRDQQPEDNNDADEVADQPAKKKRPTRVASTTPTAAAIPTVETKAPVAEQAPSKKQQILKLKAPTKRAREPKDNVLDALPDQPVSKKRQAVAQSVKPSTIASPSVKTSSEYIAPEWAKPRPAAPASRKRGQTPQTTTATPAVPVPHKRGPTPQAAAALPTPPAPTKRDKTARATAATVAAEPVPKKRGRTPKAATASGVKTKQPKSKPGGKDPKRSAAMMAAWAKRQQEGRSGRHGGAPLASTVAKREAKEKGKGEGQ